MAAQLFTNPFTRYDITYPNWFPSQAALDVAKVKVLEAAQRPGFKVFNGHSMGAQALASLLRGEPAIDPDENVFVLSGFPERKYGGKLVSTIGDGIVIYDGVGIPDDTPFRVWDVNRQYDHFADYPTINVRAAVDNINDNGAKAIHVDYSDVRIGDPRNVVYVEGNRTYVTVPTFPMPSLRNPWWSANREALADAKIRSAVESGYVRPAPIPAQTVKWYGKWGYDTKTRQFVKAPQAIWNPFH